MNIYDAVRERLHSMTDEQLAEQLFLEIGTRDEVINFIMRECPKTFDYLAEEERDAYEAFATDEALRYDFR